MKITDLTRGEERYFYRDSATWHITRAGGDQMVVFSSGQQELRHRQAGSHSYWSSNVQALL